MKLADFGILADENIHPGVTRFLRESGFDVLDVKEAELFGESDEHLLRLAFEQQRVVVTHDRDFGRLVFTQDEPFWGIIYLRPGHIDPGVTISTMRVILSQEFEVRKRFVLVAERTDERVKMRLRHR